MDRTDEMQRQLNDLERRLLDVEEQLAALMDGRGPLEPAFSDDDVAWDLELQSL